MKKIVIIGGGPAGLTAAYELARKEDVEVVVFEREQLLGGISRTLEYKGNRIDIGGHRFFSKSNIVMNWWKNIMPLQGAPSVDDIKLKRKVKLTEGGPNPEQEDGVMLVRGRLSRILYMRKFFNYPVTLSVDTLMNLGPIRVIKMGISYLTSLLNKREEKSLEDFFINRFGRELYNTFFRDYTAKVWGVSCKEIGADWGSQRVKGLSVVKVLLHALGKLCFWKKQDNAKSETSLIGEFWYPKYGPGQLWETVGREAEKKGVIIFRQYDVQEVIYERDRITGVVVRNMKDNTTEKIDADYVISTTSVKELIQKMGAGVPESVKRVSEGLVYRDFITVGLLLKTLKLKSQHMNTTVGEQGVVPDNWIYIQEPDVKVGRLQIFNNWSPYLVNKQDKIWIGMEYFVNEGDELWQMDDESFCNFAESELEKIGVIERKEVVEHCIFRIQKAYPAYFGSYKDFSHIRQWTDKIKNLYLVGRNGMHRYNNMDHSMLSALEAVKNITSGTEYKDNIWNVNAEKEYHESK